MNYPQQVTKTVDLVLDIIFPIRCLGCGKLFSNRKKDYLCKKCFVGISTNNNSECIGCKTSIGMGKTCFKCKDTNHINRLLIVLDYKNPIVVQIIKCLKYRFVQEIINPLSILIKKYIVNLSREKKFNILEKNPIIIPIPLHPKRLNWRGFNQSELIAQSLSDIIQCPVHIDSLRRIKESKPQADIKEKAERLEKPRSIFRLINSEPTKNRVIILVDDICTTGATLNEAAKILKEGGAESVIGFVVARG